jgi:tRNA G18 (ribose-2'-O)-methylase SpoU
MIFMYWFYSLLILFFGRFIQSYCLNIPDISIARQPTIRNQYQSFIILSNLQSGNNIGSVCRNALAFNVSEVLVVGRSSFISKMRMSDRGASRRLKFSMHADHQSAKEYLHTTYDCQNIYGIEILDSARRIDDADLFQGSTAFLFGNEGGGLSSKQRDICSGFVYIPQFAASGMASINVACASAITLYQFATWAGYPESTRKGEKFI